VTFDSVKINEDHDYGSGEWKKLWVGVNGRWIELSGPNGHYGLEAADNGDLIRFPAGSKTVTLTVPENGKLRIQSTGWEDDNDGYYGHGYLWYLALPPYSPIGPDKAGALNDNDKIGVVITEYSTAENFGIGPHSDASQQHGDSETLGDFNLNYHIEQLSKISPSKPTAQLPTGPQEPPVLGDTDQKGTDQMDTDKDGVIDSKDNCSQISNPDQKDTNNNGVGDVCESGDIDHDGIVDLKDNCKWVANPDQKDEDNNGVGDACKDIIL
jgi:hypothetical protein